MPGTRLVDIVDYDHIEIAFKVDEYDVGALAVGKEAIAKIGAAGKDIKGKISDISREGQIINGVTLFTATMDIDKDEDIRIGMSAEVKLLSERAENVVIIPMNVILFDEKNQPYVLKKGNRNKVVREKITTGIHDGTFVEVKSGVEAGETILYRKDDSLEHLLFPEGGKNVHFGGIME
jgi:multidrug efflux pump subunit AcrA (membrane-fusion protein)